MNIQSIKTRANEVLMPYRSQFIRVLLIVLVLTVIPKLFSADNEIISFIGMILNIVFLPASHGIIVSSLKIARNMGHTVDDQDGLAGFKRFKELFSTYVTKWVTVFLAMFVLIFVLGILIAFFLGNTILSIASLSNLTVEAVLSLIFADPTMILVVLLIAVFSLVFGLVIDAYMFAIPYVLEQYHIKGFQAVKTSFIMMKGHIFDYIKLYFSFFGWMFLAALIEGILGQVIPYASLVTITVSLFKIYTYIPLYYMSQAILFEEIAFYHFNQVGE